LPRDNDQVPREEDIDLLPSLMREGTVEAIVLMTPSQDYELFGDVDHSISVDIAARGRSDSAFNRFVVFIPLSLRIESLSAPGVNYTLSYTRLVGQINFDLPLDSSINNIEIRGTIPSTSVFWRNSMLYAQIQIAAYFGPTSVKYLLYDSPGSRILDNYVGVPPENVKIDDKNYVLVKQYTPYFTSEDVYKYYNAAILYESNSRSITSGLILASFFAILGASPYIYSSYSRHYVRNILLRFSRFFQRIIGPINSSRLLSGYVLCIFLMLSLALVAGPDPRMKVFVLAEPSTSEGIEKIVTDFGGVPLTIADTATEIETISNLGTLQTIIVSDYVPLSNEYAETFLFPALKNVRRVIIIPDEGNEFQERVRERLSEDSILESEASKLSSALNKISIRPNFFGLNIELDTYLNIARIEALLSFLLVFLGIAYLSTRLLEIGSKPGLSGLSESIIYVVSYYVITQAVLMTASYVLGMPLGLHAVTSGSKDVTALGLLGLGGGSRPRMMVAFSGVLAGALLTRKGAFRLDKSSILLFSLLIFALALDPLTNGVILYEFLLLFSVGPDFQFTTDFATMIKTFLRFVGDIFGGWVTPYFAISRGIMLYYVGAIPFVLIPKLRQTSATLLLFLSAFAISQGGIRVAEMTPLKTVTNIFPGIVAGLVFAMLFIILSLFEDKIRNIFRGN
jgi:hypothetical protein